MKRYDNELLINSCANFKQLSLERAVARTHNIGGCKAGWTLVSSAVVRYQQ